MRIIPAIDIIGGKCVRLSMGDYSTQKIYNENPLEVAKQFEDCGIKFLHLVDLDGAKSKHIVNTDILENIVSNTGLKVDFGGGIKSDEDIRIAFESGANQVTAGSIAVDDPLKVTEWIEKFGNEKIILGADFKNRMIATHGWGMQSEQDVVDFILDYIQRKIVYVICTDVSKDGMMQGPSTNMYREILSACNIKLIASGGISSMQDIILLKETGCEGAIIGKAIYEGKISLKEITGLC